jgi:cystathionine beta-lyase/cystathionine gamma-synthase
MTPDGARTAPHRPRQRRRLGIDDGVVRLPCGIEDASDLIAVLDQTVVPESP